MIFTIEFLTESRLLVLI